MRFIQLRFRASSATAAHMALLLRLARRWDGARELRCALIGTGEVRLEQMELVDGKGWLWNGFANGSPSISVPSRASLFPKPD